MDIGWFRDLVIVIFGLVASAVLIMIAILIFSLYREVRSMARSIHKTLAIIEAFAVAGTELGQSVVQVVSILPKLRDRIKSILTGKSSKDKSDAKPDSPE